MSKSKIIIISFFLIAGIAVFYFAFGVVKNRYFSKKPASSEFQESGTQVLKENQNSDESGSFPVVQPDVNEGSGAVLENGQPNVESSDCVEDCKKFENNPNNFKYCQEVCGGRPVSPKESEGECEILSGFEKDACWRDLAVSKKDIDICEKISDIRLKTVCRNRVTEEIFDY